MQVLPTVHGTYQGHWQPAQSRVAHPACGAGVGVNHVNLLLLHQRPDAAQVAPAGGVAAVRNRGRELRGPGGQRCGRVRKHPHGVALRPVRLSQLHRVGHRTREKFGRQNV